MSIHPTIAAALAPFAPPVRLFQAPPCPSDCFEWHCNFLMMDHTLVCHLEYEPAERGSYQHGLQMEPDYPAQATLIACYVRDVNVYELLDGDKVDQIEICAARDLEERQAEAQGEARAERHEYEQEY